MTNFWKLSFDNGLKKLEPIIFLLLTFILTAYFIQKYDTLSQLHKNGVIAEAQIIRVLPKRGGLAIRQIVPSYMHLAIVQGKEVKITLQRQYKPGNVRIKWLVSDDRKVAQSTPAIVLDEQGGYDFIDLMGGWLQIFLKGFGLLLLVFCYVMVSKVVFTKITSWVHSINNHFSRRA